MVSKKPLKRAEPLALRIIWTFPRVLPFAVVLVSWIAAVQIAGHEPHEFGLLPPVALWFLGLLFPVAFGMGLVAAAVAFFVEWLVNTKRLNRERRGSEPGDDQE